MAWLPPSGRRRRQFVDLDEKRLVFWRFDVGVADVRRESVGGEALARLSGEAPMDRNSDRVHGLAIDRERPDALGHHRDRLDPAAVAAHLDPLAGDDPFLLCERLADLVELLR